MLLVLGMPGASSIPEIELPAVDGFEPRDGENQWIVGFYEMPNLQPGDLYYGAEVVSVTPGLSFATVRTLAFPVFEAQASGDENVRYVETDLSDHQLFFTPNDFFTNHVANYGYWKIRANIAHDTTLGTTAVKDGHID
ncbi:MAG: hypothetical protein ACT4PT_04030, partial [Methanobacteriota archaeon]